MNKKLFALLASAAMMASFAPSVFAQSEDQEVNNDEATSSVAENTENTDSSEAEVVADSQPLTVKIVPSASKAAAGDKVTFDVLLTSPVVVESLQFNFTAQNGEITGFEFDTATCNELGFGTNIDYTADSDNLVMCYNLALTGDEVAPSGAKLGTLTVKVADDAADGDVVTVNTTGNTGNYDLGDGTFAWTTEEGTVTVGAPDSSSDSSDSVDSTDSTSSTSSTTSTTDSSSKATTNNSSKAGTNGTTSNTNTGAASTAAVALAASAAALVVISKKRK
ncbi:MAG: hypothetical protein K6F71_08605 [Ruminococcus sp.]|uniref:hypothetical protein n=1 Tax=Ruminococcus sp. TaxID=41978 RepID=UPI0025D4368B|nr:hypothetical protein [Ruminococcus sp.]MCR5540858.1 hypothetical protein [Ruminococcus sp.]